jgi:hypothetical protein
MGISSKLGAPARRNWYLRKIPTHAKGCSAQSLHSACFRLNSQDFPEGYEEQTGGPRSGPLKIGGSLRCNTCPIYREG